MAKKSSDRDDKTETDVEVAKEKTSGDATAAETPDPAADTDRPDEDTPRADDTSVEDATTLADTPDDATGTRPLPETDTEAREIEQEGAGRDRAPAPWARTTESQVEGGPEGTDPGSPEAREMVETGAQSGAADPDSAEVKTPDEIDADETDDHDRTDEPRSGSQEAPAQAAPAAAPPQTVVERRGPGFVPLVLGGVVAAGLGYFASVADLVPGLGTPGPAPEVQAALDRQAETLAALEAQLASLADSEDAAPAVDLGPVTDEISGLAARIDETAAALGDLGARVATLEERPVFSGEVTADAAEAAEAVAAMEEQMRQREEEAAARAAEAEEAVVAAREAAAEAEAEAQAARARAEAEAALTELRLAVTRGAPFAEPLADVAEVAEIPPGLSETAETGVPSLEALQESFPAAARAALPVGLRETAGDSPVDRFAAFVQGQVGGRAVAPREGDSVDAILSRAQGAVTEGDLDAALTEIADLPEGAQAELAGWTAGAEARVEVLSALETVTQALDGVN